MLRTVNVRLADTMRTNCFWFTSHGF